MRNIFFFDSMLTPKIITVVYWLSLISVVISGIATMFSYNGFWAGLGIIVGGCIFTRIWCELLIVLFKINSNLQHVADTQKER